MLSTRYIDLKKQGQLMTRITMTCADKLDLDEYVDVQVDAFSSHLKKYYVSSDFMNRELVSGSMLPQPGLGMPRCTLLYCSSQSAEY